MQKFDLKNKLKIKFMNELGQIEDGVDGGGLFKEFITKLCEKIFDPEYAFFKENEQDRKLLPNHLSK
jgi:ubiquitin-protein ligase E3 C